MFSINATASESFTINLFYLSLHGQYALHMWLYNLEFTEAYAGILCTVKAYLIFMSHSLLWRHIVLLTVGVYSSNHRLLYTIGISMTRRFQKSVGPSVRPSVCLSLCLSVRPSVCPFVTLTKKAYSSFIIDSRRIIRIPDERVWHPT